MIIEDGPSDAQILCDLLRTGLFDVWVNEEADPVEMMYAGKN